MMRVNVVRLPKEVQKFLEESGMDIGSKGANEVQQIMVIVFDHECACCTSVSIGPQAGVPVVLQGLYEEHGELNIYDATKAH